MDLFLFSLFFGDVCVTLCTDFCIKNNKPSNDHASGYRKLCFNVFIGTEKVRTKPDLCVRWQALDDRMEMVLCINAPECVMDTAYKMSVRHWCKWWTTRTLNTMGCTSNRSHTCLQSKVKKENLRIPYPHCTELSSNEVTTIKQKQSGAHGTVIGLSWANEEEKKSKE